MLAGKLNVKIQINNEYNETGVVEYKLLRFAHFKKW